MKAPSPAFSFYPKDVLSDEACSAMTNEAFGMYMRLLCYCWLEGSIPDDSARLARMVRTTGREFSRCWPSIQGCFELRGSRLYQVRLEREQLQQSARAESNRQAGLLSAKSRAANKTPQQPLPIRSNGRSTQSQPSVSVSVSGPVTSTDQHSTGPARNPLVTDRAKLESELLTLVGTEATLTDRDPPEVMMEVTSYQGSKRIAINPGTLTESRLLASVLDARRRVKDLKASRTAGKKWEPHDPGRGTDPLA